MRPKKQNKQINNVIG